MKKKLLLVSLCAATLMFTGCGKVPKLKNGEEVIASIEGKNFSANDLFDEMKKYSGANALIDMIDTYIADKEIKDNDEAKTSAEANLKQLKQQYEAYGMDFEEALLSSGFEDEEAYLDYLVKSYKKNQVVEKYLAEELTEEEIKAYYEAEIFGEITAKHILIAPEVASDATEEEKTKAEEEALKKAQDLIKKIEDGEDFDKLAKEYSDDEGTASEGGKLTFSKDQVVSEFWTASSALKDGDYTAEPVKSSYGYHIILRVSQKERPELDDVADDIKDTLVTKKLSEDSNLVNTTWVKIRETYELKIEDSAINKTYKNTIKSLEN